MKKLALMLVFAVIVIAANAQVPLNSTIDFSAANYFEYTGVAGDTAINGSNADIVFKVNRDKLYYYRVEAELDEISGSADGYPILWGSINGSDWNVIDTLSSAGDKSLSADATVALQDVSTGVLWRYFKLGLKLSTTGKWDLNYVRFRAVGKYE